MEVDGEIVEVERELDDSEYLYLQENFTVTDSIFLDENIIFSDVTPAWIDYCRNVLKAPFPTAVNGSRVQQEQHPTEKPVES